MNGKKVKELGWIASSKKDLVEFPRDARKEMGHALYIAQQGGKHKGVNIRMLNPLKDLVEQLFWKLFRMMAMERIARCTLSNLKKLCMCSMHFKRSPRVVLKQLSKIWI
jgi:hypothetical protein